MYTNASGITYNLHIRCTYNAELLLLLYIIDSDALLLPFASAAATIYYDEDYNDDHHHNDARYLKIYTVVDKCSINSTQNNLILPRPHI